MPRILTKQILRDAADLLSPGGFVSGHEFMCHAVADAETGAPWNESAPASAAFRDELAANLVSTCGNLRHKGVEYAPCVAGNGTPDSQALRFDFLNLLAESL